MTHAASLFVIFAEDRMAIVAALMLIALGVILAWYCSWILPPGTAKLRRALLDVPIQPGRVFFGPTPGDPGRKIDSDPGLRRILAHIEQEVEGMLATPPALPMDGCPPGSREAPLVMKRILYLSFVHLVRNDQRCLRQVREEMAALCACQHWNPRDHLAHAVLTAAMAIGYDWLRDRMAEGERVAIGRTILAKGLQAMYAPSPGNWWKFDAYNHAQVGYGALGLAAVVLLKDFPMPASRVLAIAIQNLRRRLDANYRANGEYREGPAYWAYGTTYSVLLIAALEGLTGSSFGLGRNPGFWCSAWHYLHSHGNTGRIANFQDSLDETSPIEIMCWFAGRLGAPDMDWFEMRKPLHLPSPCGSPSIPSGPFLPLACLWKSPLSGSYPMERELRWGGGTNDTVVYHRSGWGEEDSFVAFKGGTPRVRHGQMDAGAFVFEMDGVRWGIDLGNVDYGTMAARGIHLWSYHNRAQRWKVFRLNNHGHSTLVIDGRKQAAKGMARILGTSELPGRRCTVMDLSELYRPEAARVLRGISLPENGAGLLVQDEVKASRKAILVRWAMVTRASVSRLEGPWVLLEQAGKQLWMEVQGGSECRWEVFQTDPPPSSHDEGNPGTRIIGFTAMLHPGKDFHSTVRMVRLRESKTVDAMLPLCSWIASRGDG